MVFYSMFQQAKIKVAGKVTTSSEAWDACSLLKSDTFWQNFVAHGCVTEIPVFLLAVSFQREQIPCLFIHPNRT